VVQLVVAETLNHAFQVAESRTPTETLECIITDRSGRPPPSRFATLPLLN
jgi:hypothetical protein